MKAKTVFVVSTRLEPDKPFVCLTYAFSLYRDAESRLSEWLTGAAELPKAKPEGIIEAQERKNLADCQKCQCHLFEDEIAFFTRDGIFCYECSYKTGIGYYALLELSEINNLTEHIQL